MNIIYAVYKENILPLVGGINPNEIEIGLAEYKDWKLCAMDESEFDKFSEFKLYPIPKSIAVGMMLNGESYQEIQEDLDIIPADVKEETNKTLTEDEIKLQKLAREYLDKLELKFITRAKIRQFKDFEDDLADTKLLVEFLLGYIAEDFSNKSNKEKEAFPMKDLMEDFVSSFEGKNLRIKNKKIMNKIPQIIKDENFISRIVKSNYVERIKKLG